jgi:putative transposase
MTASKHKAERIDLKALVGNDREFLRQLIRTTLQEVLEAEMTEALAAAKSERTVGRNGYRSGYYGRSLITRVGKLELPYRRIARDGFQPSYSSAISARNAH